MLGGKITRSTTNTTRRAAVFLCKALCHRSSFLEYGANRAQQFIHVFRLFMISDLQRTVIRTDNFIGNLDALCPSSLGNGGRFEYQEILLAVLAQMSPCVDLLKAIFDLPKRQPQNANEEFENTDSRFQRDQTNRPYDENSDFYDAFERCEVTRGTVRGARGYKGPDAVRVLMTAKWEDNAPGGEAECDKGLESFHIPRAILVWHEVALVASCSLQAKVLSKARLCRPT
jgi:hypothetical protein